MFANIAQRRRQAGDTIVEVMIVVAILGLAFSIAYATATHSLSKTRNAEEHSEALQYINSQVELLRNDATNPTEIQLAGVTFCMNPATDKPVLISNPAFTTVCTVGIENIYKVTINYQRHIAGSPENPDDIYKVTITWPGLSDMGTQQEDMYYKLHAL